jgi:hypothetical protein
LWFRYKQVSLYKLYRKSTEVVRSINSLGHLIAFSWNLRVGAVFREDPKRRYITRRPPSPSSANYKLCSGWCSVRVNERGFVPELEGKTAFDPEEV